MPTPIASGTAMAAVIEARISVFCSRGPITAITALPEKEVPRSPIAALPSHST